ncbi:MAG: hypothetical protein ACKN9T_03885 [Candidatus Methylumidiphilus sp.]
MSSETIASVVKMLESLPESAQTEAAEYLKNHIAEVQDEILWDGLFKSTESKLIAMARQAKQEIADGKARPMNFDEL